MAEEQYKDYLAGRVLSEQKPVTYRLLSRALKTNVNTAKRMLFDFHKKQNAKKPKSVHATYLITGTQRDSEHTNDSNGTNGRNGEDTDMRSSPFMSSMPEPEDSDESEEDDEKPVKETTLLLVREEELEETRTEFADIYSIHIYSLEPGPLENLHVLSACNREIADEHAKKEDPLERWKTYGSIRNPHIKRRTAKYAPPAAASAPKPVAKPVAKTATNPIAKLGAKKEAPAQARKGSASDDNTSERSTAQPPAGPSTLKRTDSKSGAKKDKSAGDIFKSFAKAKAKPKEAERSKESTPAPLENGKYLLTCPEPMQGMSEDEGDADDEPAIKVDEEKNEAARKVREDRAEKLRKMMEDDDEDMPDAPAADSQPEVTPPAAADTPEPIEGEPTITVQNGRRRGRRRVMKKKKVKDEDGYLVTKEEAVWESFSEDEPQPKKHKPAPAKPANSAKGKNAVKKGQGSIASFFKKA
ncbi:hypothetical protein EJ02DRAFT_341034 [Clathrospora elynae]|uniref:DNA polymerase delta subunit 3 n=1 Tax=Clathrospora elynae TaxID=706981 RepID=A0A6A5SVU4_9PLEO|nr:hypothetical protein EJ02DRAFT_341034 [Clathrospora elynae]